MILLNEGKQVLDRLTEAITAKDLDRGAMSQFTQHFYDVRTALMGTANKNQNSRLVKCEYDKANDWVTFTFQTQPTPIIKQSKVNGTVKQTVTKSTKPPYTEMIRVLDFVALLVETRPDDMEGEPINWTDIRTVIENADIKVWCSCESFYWQGISYWLTQMDGCVYPNNIHPEHWNDKKLHGEGNAFICKHIASIWNSLGFFATQMTSSVQKVLRQNGILDKDDVPVGEVYHIKN